MRILLGGLRFTAYLLVALILALAVLVGVGRALFPLLSDMADPLQQQLSKRLGVSVSFNAVQGDWQGLSPQLHFEDLQVADPQTGEPFFQAAGMTLRWHILTSLLYFKPALDLTLFGADFTLAHTDQGLLWRGLPPRRESIRPGDLGWLDTWLTHANLAAEQSRIRVQGVWANDVILDEFALHYRVRNARARLSGQLRLQSTQEASIQILADWQGRFADRGSLSGQSYFNINAVDMAEWIPRAWQREDTVALVTGDGHIEAWANFYRGQLRRVTSQVRFGSVAVAHPEQPLSAGWHSLQATLSWQSLGEKHWFLQISDLTMVTADQLWLPDRMLMECWHEIDQQQCRAALDRIELKPWVDVAKAMLAPDSGVAAALASLSPSGELNNLYAQWQMGRHALDNYRVTGHLRRFTQQSHGLIPGVADVALHFVMHEQGGLIDIAPQATQLNYPALFREPLEVQQLSGQLRWLREPTQWRLESSQLELAAADGGGVCQLSVDFPDNPKDSPYLRLQATLYDVDAARASHYLPAGILPENLVRWLDGAVIDGRLLRGDLVFHGPVRWRENKEPLQYLLGFQVDQARFAFLPDWRPVENAVADVLVEHGNVDVSVLGGNYYGTQVSEGRVTWSKPTNHADPEPLQVRVRTQGDLQQAFSVLRDSPISRVVGEGLDALALTGQVDVELEVDAPLAGDKPVAVRVAAQVDQATLSLPENNLTVTAIRGHVGYDDQRGVHSKGLDGFFLEAPVRVTLATRPRAGSRDTHISGRGRVALPALGDWLGQSWLEPASGTLNYRLNLVLRPRPAGSAATQWLGHQLEIQSDLAGVDIALPAPVAKTALEERPLRISTSLGKPVQDWVISVPDLGSLALRFRDGKPERGELLLGTDLSASVPETPGLNISGYLSELDLQPWWSARDAWQASSTEDISVDQQAASPAWLDLLNDVRVEIADLRWDAQVFGSTSLIWSRQAEHWHLNLQGDWVEADVQIPFALQGVDSYTPDHPALDLHIRRLALHIPPSVGPIADVVVKPAQHLDPGRLPPVSLRLDALQINDQPFGRWHAQLIPTVQGVLVSDADLQFREVTFQGQGEWLQSVSGVRTSMRGKATAGNVGDVLAAWGYEPTLGSNTAELQLQASWPGAPYDFNLLSANATARLLLREGQFYRISSGAADKVLGVLNVDSWLDRLRLQFRDLSSDEMTYSELRGRVDLSAGVLGVHQVQLESPAMRMAMQGDIHLADGLLDLTMAVTVPVTRNLILPAAAVGGLPAAATVFVIERVLGSQLDKLTTMQYQVTGPLREPVVTLKDTFNIIPKPLQETLVTEPRARETAPQPEMSDGPTEPE